MKEDDKIRFKTAMHIIEITFNSDFDRARLAAYYMALEDLPIDTIEAAVKKIAREEKRTPPPAVIREYANEIRRVNSATREEPLRISHVQPQSEFGKEALSAILDYLSGNIAWREYLKRAGRLADKYSQIELAEYVMEEWNKLTQEA